MTPVRPADLTPAENAALTRALHDLVSEAAYVHNGPRADRLSPDGPRPQAGAHLHVRPRRPLSRAAS